MKHLPSHDRRLLLQLTLTLPALLAAVACSSGAGTTGSGGSSTTSTTTAGTGGSTSTTTSSTGGGTAAGGDMTCPPPMKYGGGEMKVMGASAMAAIVDETGAPVPMQPIYICGIDICSAPSKTGADGTVKITTDITLTKPAFKYGDTINYAEFAVPVPMGATDFTAGGTKKLGTGKLSNKPGATLTPGADATSGDVTISVPAGASVGIDELVYDTPEKAKLRTVNVPLANLAQVLEPVKIGGASADFALVYGLAPAETPVCPAAKVAVTLPHATMMPNDLGWAPGTAVEFWIMTTDTGQEYAPYAGWAKMSDGAVSADGKSVATAEGQGFIYLESFAIRLKK